MYREERNKQTKKRGKLRRIFSLRNEYGQWHSGRILIGLVSLFLLLLVFFGTMLFSVGVGSAGMRIDPLTNSISDPIIGPTWGIKMPWESLITVPYARESLGMWGDGTDEYADFPAIKCFSDEGAELSVDIMIRWQIDLNKIKDLYQSYPSLNWEDRAVASVARESIRFVMGEYKAMYIVENREAIAVEIEQKLIDEIQTEPSLRGALINIEVDLRNIGLPEKLTVAIEEKLAAEQAKIQAEYEAQKKIILANAEATALLIGANATAQQKVIDAEGIKQAIDTLIAGHNITDADYMDFLQLYAYLKTLETLAESKGINFIVGIEDGNIFIQPSP